MLDHTQASGQSPHLGGQLYRILHTHHFKWIRSTEDGFILMYDTFSCIFNYSCTKENSITF